MTKPVFEVFFRHIWVFQRFFGDGEFQFFLFRFELIQAFFRGVRNNTHLDGVYPAFFYGECSRRRIAYREGFYNASFGNDISISSVPSDRYASV